MSTGLQTPTKDNLPAIAGARLPYHPALKEKYDIDAGQWRVLVDAIFPAAQTIESVVMALAYCRARKLDVMKHQCHIVPIWDNKRNQYVETVWPSISELRTTAFRTGSYAGTDPTAWGDDVTETFGSGATACEVTYPSWAQVTVYRLVQGTRCAFPGPRVYWKETFAKGKGNGPNTMWCKRPRGQLEKCAQAAALRNAFPEEIGGDLSSDEAEGIELHHGRMGVAVPAEPQAKRISKVEALAAALQLDADAIGPDTVYDDVNQTLDAESVDEPPPNASYLLDAIADATTVHAVRAAVRQGWDVTDPITREQITKAGLAREDELATAPKPTHTPIQVYADAIGALATIREVQAFLKDGLPAVPPELKADAEKLAMERIRIIKAGHADGQRR